MSKQVIFEINKVILRNVHTNLTVQGLSIRIYLRSSLWMRMIGESCKGFDATTDPVELVLHRQRRTLFKVAQRLAKNTKTPYGPKHDSEFS